MENKKIPAHEPLSSQDHLRHASNKYLILEDRKWDLHSRTNIVSEDEGVHVTSSRSGTQGTTTSGTSIFDHTYGSLTSSMPLVQRGSGRRDPPETPTPPPPLLQVLVVNYFGSASLQALAKMVKHQEQEMERDSRGREDEYVQHYIGEGAAT
jgi:hypothetical protein